VGGACVVCGRGEKIVRGFGGKAVGKETTQKTDDGIGRGGGLWSGFSWLRTEAGGGLL
jgi:hypothetical protein